MSKWIYGKLVKLGLKLDWMFSWKERVSYLLGGLDIRKLGLGTGTTEKKPKEMKLYEKRGIREVKIVLDNQHTPNEMRLPDMSSQLCVTTVSCQTNSPIGPFIAHPRS